MSDQSAVWREVDQTLDRAGIYSPTAALEDAFDGAGPHRADNIRPVEGQVGVVSVIAGRPVAIDLFDKPEVLNAYWEALVAGYLLHLDETEAPLGRDVTSAVEAFIDEIEAAPMTEGPAVGLGEELLFDSDTVVGAGLRWDGALVHLSAYALAGNSGEVGL